MNTSHYHTVQILTMSSFFDDAFLYCYFLLKDFSFCGHSHDRDILCSISNLHRTRINPHRTRVTRGITLCTWYTWTTEDKSPLRLRTATHMHFNTFSKIRLPEKRTARPFRETLSLRGRRLAVSFHIYSPTNKTWATAFGTRLK